MAKQHVISQSYSGGGATPISLSTTNSGAEELDFSGTSSSATTTFGGAFVMTPSTAIQCAVFSGSGGDSSLTFVNNAGVATVTLNLPNNTPVIVQSVGGVCPLVPTGADTYTLKLVNANQSTATITFDGRILRS